MTRTLIDARIVAGLSAALTGAVPQPAAEPMCLVQLCFRRKGVKLARVWGEGHGLEAALHDGTSRADIAPHKITHIEVTLARPGRLMQQSDMSRARANDVRGLLGVELRGTDKICRMGPVEMLTRNIGPKTALRMLSKDIGQPLSQLEARVFPADQFLVEWPNARIHRLFRGQKTVPPKAITRAAVLNMAQAMEDWLTAQVGADGSTMYKYWPSKGIYATSNNMIRQFMASAALANIGHRRGGADAANRNFAYNFTAFYTEEDGLGLIHEGPKVKLGAAAVALIACLNLGDERFQPQIAALSKFILSMQNPEGSFCTFLRPSSRNDCQNFYPGEACLALMRLFDRTKDPTLLDAVGRAFAFYRPWHLENRNPAFVPWHTSALCLFLRHRPDKDLSDFVFDMNDWLLGLQQQADRPADVWGEFFDPERPDFGPPHASATGVYLEGLIDAWDLARRLDVARSESYRRAILLGLRSLRQLQFRYPSDMYYIANKNRVAGALRTNTYDNTIRIDNVQHGLMAMHRILDLWPESLFHT